LEDLPKGHKLNVYNIKTNLIKGSAPLFKNETSDTPYRHRLILIESETVGFVCGLESYEYQVQGSLVVYISKVDTSGGLPNGLTSRLVCSYVSSLKQPCTVHVFARAQPQYLFAESSKNTEKKALDDRGLVSWWLHTLNKVPAKDIKAWWYIPGIDDEQSALIEVGARKREWKSADHIEWKYGSSYTDDALASQVIPRFDDDAKTRLLKDHPDAALKVSEFWGLLSISEECGSGKLAGFFELKLNQATQQQEEQEEKSIKNSNFTLFWNDFMSLDFSNRSSILKSSEKALKDIKSIFPEMKPLQIETKKEQTNVVTNNDDNKRQAVNTLSASFIKRRKK
jgi:hypothetical protein